MTHERIVGFVMLSLEKLRKIVPNLDHLSDEELLELRDLYYGLTDLALEKMNEETSSKIPCGLLPESHNPS